MKDKPKSYHEAVERYRAGDYTMGAPPVSSSNWDEPDWIKFIWGIDKNYVVSSHLDAKIGDADD